MIHHSREKSDNLPKYKLNHHSQEKSDNLFGHHIYLCVFLNSIHKYTEIYDGIVYLSIYLSV